MEPLEATAALCWKFEGFSAKPYLCPAGVWTYGVGATIDVNGHPVTASTPPISRDDAHRLLMRQLVGYQNGTLAACPILAAYPLKLAAITDFAYNLGLGRLKASTLRRRINEGNWAEAADELMRWTRGGGRVLPGLVRRRAAERELLLT